MFINIIINERRSKNPKHRFNRFVLILVGTCSNFTVRKHYRARRCRPWWLYRRRTGFRKCLAIVVLCHARIPRGCKTGHIKALNSARFDFLGRCHHSFYDLIINKYAVFGNPIWKSAIRVLFCRGKYDPLFIINRSETCNS